MDRRLGGTQNRFGLGGEEKSFQSLPGLEPPIIQPVAQRPAPTHLLLRWIHKTHHYYHQHQRFAVIKGIGKVVPGYEGVLGSRGIAPHILDLVTRRRWVVGFAPRPPYPHGRGTCYPLDRRLGGLQNWSGCGGEEKNSQPLPGLEPPIIQPVYSWVRYRIVQCGKMFVGYY
jgi:hypothetical protein